MLGINLRKGGFFLLIIMFTTIITDCKSENARLRQTTRFNSLGLGPSTLAGVNSDFGVDATIEAAGNLIDALDASGGKKGIICVNVAPRGNKKEDGENGTSFSYFFHKDTLVISTVKGYCLSLVKEFSIKRDVNLLDIDKVLGFAKTKKLITSQERDRVIMSQFRSFDFVPYVAMWIIEGIKVPYKPFFLSAVPDIPSCIWCIDAFGNAKTTLTKDSLPNTKISKKSSFLHNNMGRKIDTNIGALPFYKRLKDVPNGKTAMYIGSSGLDNRRFLEIASQGVAGSAAASLNLKVGDKIKML